MERYEVPQYASKQVVRAFVHTGIKFRVNPSHASGVIAGLTAWGSVSGTGQDSVGWGIWCTGSSFQIREGSTARGDFGTYSANDWFEVQVTDDNKVRYIHEGNVVYESTTSVSGSVGAHVALYSSSKVYDATFVSQPDSAQQSDSSVALHSLACSDIKDLAWNKTATASNSHSDAHYVPAKSIDTAQETFWRTADGTTSADWTVDLGSQFHIERVSISWSHRATAFTVHLSDDNSAFTEEAEMTSNSDDLSEFPIHTLGRYLKVSHSCDPTVS